MTPAEIVQALEERFGGKITGRSLEALDPWVEVEPGAVAEVARFLKDDPRLSFDSLQCLSGVDYCEPDPKKAAKAGFEPHLEVVYHLYSFKQRHKIVMKALVPRWKGGAEGQLPEVPTVSGIWRTADWHERETFDLCGVKFVGHPELARILCPDDWVGHPLRKDYEMPLEYHGIRGK